jgi:hypothetical protein
MHATEGAQVGPEPRASSFTGVAVHLPPAIGIIIPRPFVHPVADSRMARMAAPIALPLVGVELCAASRNVFGDKAAARLRVGVITHPKAVFARLPRHHTDDGWAIIGIGPMPLALIGPAARRIVGVAMGRAFFPPRSDTVHRPQRPYHASHQPARSHSGWLGCAAAMYRAVSVTAPARGLSARWARPWQCRGAAAPAWPAVAVSFRTRSPLAAYSSHDRCDNDRLESTLARGIAGALSWRSADISRRSGAGGVPARGCRCYRPAAQ